jgi:hypothetical protein
MCHKHGILHGGGGITLEVEKEDSEEDDDEAATIIRALMTEAASTSKTSVNFYQTTWCNNPEDNHLQEHYLEMKEQDN